MNKFIVLIIAIFAFANVALADEYVSADYQDKQKVGVAENHHVVGVNYGYTFNDLGLAVEARVEDEVVTDPSKHEGLFQGKVVYSIPAAVLEVYPYVAGTIGYKSRSNSENTNFAFYAVEAGLKYSEINNVDIKYGVRLRTPFNESSMGYGNHYRTVENSLSVAYHITDKCQIAAKYAREHGDSNYHVWGIGLAHSF